MNEGKGFDGDTDEFLSLKYPTNDSDLVLADGVEARLIEADAIYSSNFDGALDILNDLRDDAEATMTARNSRYTGLGDAWGYVQPAPLDDLVDPGTDAARLDMIMSERAMWLFGTGHRQGDLRRLVVNYGRSVNDVCPSGQYSRQGGGLSYGSDLLAQVDFDEANNPQYEHSMCTTTVF